MIVNFCVHHSLFGLSLPLVGIESVSQSDIESDPLLNKTDRVSQLYDPTKHNTKYNCRKFERRKKV